jgi:sugar/nucleoside kinase (ribokinase family)
VSARLVVVGSLALDDIEAPSGKVGGVLGGAASHFAVAASYFGPVSVVGVIGADFPREHLEFLKGKGVDTSGIEAKEGRSFRWGGRYSAALEKRDTLFTELGVFDGWQPELAAAHRGAPFVFLANIHPEIQLRTLEQVRAPRFTAMDTMNFWIDGTPAELRRTLARVNGLVINDEEARQLTGESNLVRAATAIHALGPKVVIVKRGEHGALLFDDAGIFSAPAFPLREVQDPTGAGDSFAGGFMGYLAGQDTLNVGHIKRAIAYGTVTASVTVEGFGVDALAACDRTKIERRFLDLMQFVGM